MTTMMTMTMMLMIMPVIKQSDTKTASIPGVSGDLMTRAEFFLFMWMNESPSTAATFTTQASPQLHMLPNTVWVKKKSPPRDFLTFFPNGWEFLVHILRAYYPFLLDLGARARASGSEREMGRARASEIFPVSERQYIWASWSERNLEQHDFFSFSMLADCQLLHTNSINSLVHDNYGQFFPL